MTSITSERKEAILKKLLPPHNMTVAEVAKEEDISTKTLYNWRHQIKKSGKPVPGKTSSAEAWSAETKLAVIIETTPLSESELSKYCRETGLLVELVKDWKVRCLTGFQTSKDQELVARKQAKTDKAEIKSLKKELRRKEKALAETAALLVLRKKLNEL
jgi:putative transposase